MLKYNDLFDLKSNIFLNLFNNTEHVWDGLKNIKVYIKQILKPNIVKLYEKGLITKYNTVLNKTVILFNDDIITSDFEINGIDSVSKGKLNVKHKDKVLVGASVLFAGSVWMNEEVYIGAGSIVEPGAMITGPCYIGNNTEIRQCAYLRGNVIIGDRCVVGHTTEMKSSVMLGDSKAGHFAYIGDSILGKVNLGAGTKLANLKLGSSQVILKINENIYETGLKKFGAIIGDNVETGCNTVTVPGTIISKDVVVYPNTTARGFYKSSLIVKSNGLAVAKNNF